MTKIAATAEQVIRIASAPDAVYDFFSQPERLRTAMTGVERCETFDDGRVRWVLAEKVEKGIRFQADYTVTYDGDGSRHVYWRFVEGNMENDGDVWIEPRTDGHSEIRYRETVAPDLPITKLMAQLIKPIVACELRRDLNDFLLRAQRQLAD